MKKLYKKFLDFVKDKKFFNKNKEIDPNFSKVYRIEIEEYLKQHWSKNISELYYCIINNIFKQPKCYCGGDLNFRRFSNGYTVFCSPKCAQNNNKTKEKQSKTNIKKYGSKSPTQSKEILEKRKKNNIEKWGIDNPSKLSEIKEKIKQTNIEKYGETSYLKTKEKQEKSKKTSLKKYGTEFPIQNNKIKYKMQKTNLKKYGNVCSLHGKEIKEKVKKTWIKKYGIDNPERKHIKNIENLNSDFINKNFKNKNGLLHKENIKKYFNISESFLQISQNKLKKSPLLNIEELLPFFYQHQKTQNIIYNFIYKKYNDNKNTKYLKNIFINDKFYLKYNTNIKKILELDILDLNNNVAIEYNGLMYHSFGKHNLSKFNNYELEENKKYNHQLKTNLCEEKNLELFHIMENEWLDKRKQKIWINIIHKSLKLFNNIKIIKKENLINYNICFINDYNLEQNINNINFNNIKEYILNNNLEQKIKMNNMDYDLLNQNYIILIKDNIIISLFILINQEIIDKVYKLNEEEYNTYIYYIPNIDYYFEDFIDINLLLNYLNNNNNLNNLDFDNYKLILNRRFKNNINLINYLKTKFNNYYITDINKYEFIDNQNNIRYWYDSGYYIFNN